jgi:hypothetical protein
MGNVAIALDAHIEVINNVATYDGPVWKKLDNDQRTELMREALKLALSYKDIGVLLQVPGQNDGRSAICGHAYRHLTKEERPGKSTGTNPRKGPRAPSSGKNVSAKAVPHKETLKLIDSIVLPKIELDLSNAGLAPHLYNAPPYRPDKKEK